MKLLVLAISALLGPRDRTKPPAPRHPRRRDRAHRRGGPGIAGDAGRGRTGESAVPVRGPQKTRWSNLPTGIFERQGLRMGDLTPPQRAAVDHAAAGGVERRRIPQGDRDHARRRRGRCAPAARRGGARWRARRWGRAVRAWRRRARRGGGRGGLTSARPSTTSRSSGRRRRPTPWMLQFGGHHLAINLTLAGSQASMTPSLPAAQPATYTFEGREIRPLGKENDKAFALINALDEKQRGQAILGSRVADLVLGPGQDGRVIQPEGLRASAMSPAQQDMLLDIVREWAGIMNDAFAGPRMAEIRAQPAADLFRVERPDDGGQRRVLPHPGADAGDRVRAAGRRRSHPHHLPRSDQRLRCEVRGEVAALALAAFALVVVARRRLVRAPARRISAGGARRDRSRSRGDRAGPDAGHRGRGAGAGGHRPRRRRGDHAAGGAARTCSAC